MGRRPGGWTGGTGFGDVLKAIRERLGISQQELADRTGMNVWGVAKLEQGQREPSWPTVLTLADALGVTPDDFRPAVEPEEPPDGGAKGKRKRKAKG